MKSKLKLNIISKLIFLLISQIAICQSDEDITSYWNTLTKEQRIEQIRRLYQIENAHPIFSDIITVATLSDNDLYITYPNPIDLTISDLHYQINLPQIVIKNFVEKRSIFKSIFTPILCGIIGLSSTVISGNYSPIIMTINTFLGFLAGIGINLIE